MARNKKRPAYVQEIVNSVNERLKISKEKNAFSPLMIWICDYLVSKGMYQGYTFFNEKLNHKGEPYNSLAGSATDFEYLQVY